MRTSRVVALVAVLLAPAALVSAQAEPSAAPAKPSHDSLTLIRQRGKLLACVPPHAPWVIHAADGKLKGFSVDLGKQLAEDLGVGVEFVVEESSRLLLSLAEGDCDVIVGGLSATPQRALFAHFSDPVARHDIVLVADKQASSGWRRPEDLDKPDVSIGFIAGGVLAPHVKRLFPKAKLVELADWSALGAALTSGQVKAAV